MNEHYCQLHKTKFFENTKGDSHWWSHKTDDPAFPKGYHNEDKPKEEKPLPEGVTRGMPVKNNDSFYTCNALNNTVALIVGGKVEISQLEPTYKKLLKLLEGETE